MATTFPTTFLYTPSRIPSSNYRFNSSSFHYSNTICFKSYSYRFNRECRRMFRRCCSSLTMKDCSNGNVNGGDAVDTRSRSNEIWEDSQCVEVIGIGNRVDAVLDFCHSSTSPSQSLRFWNVIRSEPRGQLRQKFLGKDDYPNIVEAPLNEKSYLKAVVLVASAGYGDDSVVATDILRAIKSGGGLVVAIMMKPFSFEGQRRQDEVKILVNELQDCVNFCIDIDIDTLLKMDLVTLDEALKTAYTAIFSAVRAVSILVSNEHKRHVHSLHGGFRQITAAEVIKVLESYKEGKVGFGFGHNVEDSITQAVYDCPFLSIGLKDLNGVVICIISSSRAIGDSEVRTLLRAFCQATECTREVMLSVVHDPDMKPNLIGTTVITVCVTESKSFHKTSLLSRLADSIPFVFNLLRRNYLQSESPDGVNLREDVLPPVPAKFLDKNKVSNMAPEEGIDQNVGIFYGKDILLNEDCDEKQFDYDATDEVDYLEADRDSFNYAEQNFEGAQALEREPLINRSGGSGFRIVPDRLEEDVIITESVPVADNPRVFHLPVGTRRSDELQNTSNRSNSRRPVKRATHEYAKLQGSAVPSVSSLNGFTDAGLEVVIDFWSSASSLLRGRQLDTSKKQGVLSTRASSMLEAERDSNTKWSRMVEIGYKGGIYKGRCQGGLPEGRGRLIFQDDSVYDGMWRYGKRSGIGSLFFSNGDVFHGSWRDDLMHGKGWLYFHSGERWFANFWKGRANGEGRFYSKSGEVFFGQFQDGWRHGRFLCIKVDGTRYVETWNDGTLVSSEELEA